LGLLFDLSAAQVYWGLSGVIKSLLDTLPATEGYKNVATTSFVGTGATEREQMLLPSEAESYLLQHVNFSTSMPTTLSSCKKDHEIHHYRNHLERSFSLANPRMCELESGCSPVASKGWFGPCSDASAWVTKCNRQMDLNFENSMDLIFDLQDQGFIVEGVTIETESCRFKDLFGPHSYVVLSLIKGEDGKHKDDKQDKLFLRVDWERGGWFLQQQEQDIFQSHFGLLGDAETPAGRARTFKPGCGQALKAVWGAFEEWQKTNSAYTDQWNSLEAAAQLYSRVTGQTASVKQ